jgi:hypothetical protein
MRGSFRLTASLSSVGLGKHGGAEYARVIMGRLIERFRAWRAARKQDRAAIARAVQQQRRADGEPVRSLSETVEDVAGEHPPLG